MISRIAILAALLGAGSAVAALSEPLQMARVVEASQAGVSPGTVLAEMKRKRTSFALRGSQFGQLKAAGVADPVLDQIQQSFVSDVDLLIRLWMGGGSHGKCERCYPWQVDLASLPDLAGVRQTSAPLRSVPGRALGLPDWFRPLGSTGMRRITVAEVEAMVRAGNPPDDVVGALRSSRLSDVIGTGGFATGVTTGIQPALTGSQLAALREGGMPDAVLDELQTRYLAELVEHLRFRYQGAGKGSRP